MDAHKSSEFLPFHKWDRAFFAGFVLVSWGAVLWGFLPRLILVIGGSSPPPHPFLHIHAVGFFGWLVVLSLQVLLINTHKIEWHKRLGMLGAGLAVIIVPLGIAAAIVTHRTAFAAGHAERLTFLSVQIMAMLIFAGFAGLAIAKRADGPAHKRLILLATTELLGAGFGRALGGVMFKTFGDSVLTFGFNLYMGCYVVIIIAMLYDFVTRSKVHIVYLIGFPVTVGAHLVMSYVNHAPWWPAMAQTLIGF